ncbi:MAG TPA: right-handed parallel beta-helix repeat-containing protein [Planctomycetota bacterium]|nr:right-handed parallel beta-helix repeat-containing protein [Planctomycetota bacterium]HRR79405.1 right-handed parallel beta-helix repeat-containing protein [Planctomycetota bacterium]HRT93502.1 right-handed parallel beta-helix repeat-containing protein [Planctomycetota bacterium]
MQKRKLLAVVGALVVAMQASRAASFFVAPDGTAQGDGTREKPFSLAAIPREKLKPGDEVVFLDGVYKGTLSISSIGNEKGPIVYRAANRHRAILDGGTPVAGWQKAPNLAGVWTCRMNAVPERFLVNGEGLIPSTSRWRRDGKESLDEGMFASEKIERDPDVLEEDKGGARNRESGESGERPAHSRDSRDSRFAGSRFLVHIRPWAGAEPKEVFALSGTILHVSGAYNIVDGFLVRRGVIGIGLGGKLVHTYKQEAGTYLDISGLANNSYGSFNIVRNCIVRDMMGCGMTSNESRFNLIEDCVIYNAGMGQGDHGIYISQGAENLVLRRNVWWRTSGGAIHIYSGTGVDSPRNIVVERNVFGPDKRNRCFPLAGRKSAAVYVWGGSRWAGGNRIVHNLVLGPVDRAMSVHKCHFNLIAHNTLVGSDGAPVQIGESFGNLILNNILEYAPGGEAHPGGYVNFLDDARGPALNTVRGNLLLPRGDGGKEVPAWALASKFAAADPFVDRAKFDFRLKPDSQAIGLGIPFPHLTPEGKDKAPSAGALEPGDEVFGEKGKFPEIPQWLLDEWPLSRRGQ